MRPCRTLLNSLDTLMHGTLPIEVPKREKLKLLCIYQLTKTNCPWDWVSFYHVFFFSKVGPVNIEVFFSDFFLTKRVSLGSNVFLKENSKTRQAFEIAARFLLRFWVSCKEYIWKQGLIGKPTRESFPGGQTIRGGWAVYMWKRCPLVFSRVPTLQSINHLKTAKWRVSFVWQSLSLMKEFFCFIQFSIPFVYPLV